MPMTLRSLTRQSIERFRGYLDRLRHGAVEEPPRHLLDESGEASELPVEILVESQIATGRLHAAKYLCEILAPLERSRVDQDAGLWAWLSLHFFDQVCPVAGNGTRRPGRDYRHIADFSYRHRHRHLLYGPYHVYRQYGIRSILLLTGTLESEPAIYHEIASRQDLISNRGAIEAAMLLYFDPARMAPKRGAQEAKGRGTVRRFVRLLQQLDLTYDIYGLSGKQILELLPDEFDVWRKSE